MGRLALAPTSYSGAQAILVQKSPAFSAEGSMGYGYGLELRTRIVKAYQNGEGSIRDIAERFAVSPGTVQDYLRLMRSTGRLDPRPVGGGVDPLIDVDGLEQVRELLAQQPDATTEELADRFARERAVAVSRPTMGRALQRLGLTRKKNVTCDRAGEPACAEAAPGVPTRRERAAYAKPRLHR
jgi:transposase